MSLLIGNGMCLTYTETETTCPICEQKFDAASKMERARYPIFNTKCPHCKGKITIKDPVFGGHTECWETNCPPSVKRLKTITPNHVNGIPYLPDEALGILSKLKGSKYDEGDEEEGDGDADLPAYPPKPKLTI